MVCASVRMSGSCSANGWPARAARRALASNCAAFVPGKPVAGIAHQVVAQLRPSCEVERFGERPEAHDFLHIHLAGQVEVIGNSLEPTHAPVRAQHALHLRAQPLLDRRDYLRGAIVVRERRDVLVEIARSRRADAERVHLGAGEAVEVVEGDGRERRAEFTSFAGGS